MSKQLGLNIEKSRWKDFIRIAWPAATEGILISLLSSVDLIMAASLGAASQAAIGIISQPKMMALLFVRAFATALTAVLSRRYGEDKVDDMNRIYQEGICLTLIFYLILIVLSQVFLPNILKIAGAKSSYFDLAMTYGRLIFIGLFFNALAMTVNSGLIAIGQTRVIFVANVFGNIVNCILNYIFIYGIFGLPKLGIFGIGLGTLIGSIVSLIISIYGIKSQDFGKSLSFKGGWWRPVKKDLMPALKVLKGTLPEQFFERAGMFLYTVMVADLGLVEMAVHHIAMNLCDIFYSSAMGLGTATSSLTGQMLGRKDPDEAFKYGKIGEKAGLILGLIGFILFYFLRRPIFSLFSQDPQAIDLGSEIMIIVALASIPQSLSLVHSGVLKGAGYTRYVARYSFVIITIIRPLLTYLFIYKLGMGLLGAWLSLIIDQSLRALAATRGFYSRKWENISL